jgi:hypothetical protein
MDMTNEPKPPQPLASEARAAAKPRSRPVAPSESEPMEASAGHLLGADGREVAAESPKDILSQLSTPLLRFTERNPKGAALLSLGVGLVAGAILGAVVRRD